MKTRPMSHKRAAELGWTRVDRRPWTKLRAIWTHGTGYRLEHCGHPTALRPWMLHDPEGRMVLTGAVVEGQPSTDGSGPISRFVHGTAWWTLEEPMEWVAKQAMAGRGL